MKQLTLTLLLSLSLTIAFAQNKPAAKKTTKKEVNWDTATISKELVRDAIQFMAEVRSNVPQVVITDNDGDQTIYKGIPYVLDIWDKNQ